MERKFTMTRTAGVPARGLLSAALCLGASAASPPPLRVSDNGHFLVAQDAIQRDLGGQRRI
jgi:hypothetical protein